MRFISLACAASLVGTLGLLAACTTTVHEFVPFDGDASTGPDTGSKDGGGGGKADGGGGGGGGGSTCEKICEKAASASCSTQATCVTDCEADQDKIPAACQDEADALNACSLTSAATFKCNSKGRPVLATGCDTEGNALVQCVLGGGGGGDGGGGGGGGGNCGDLTSGVATCDTCMTAKCCAQGAACSANAACTDIIDCFATNNCTTQACITQCENAHPTGRTAEQAFFACVDTQCSVQCQ